jgi:hypothetical protein
MALKITSQIGTDKGITSEAYVRIADYQISKSGSANFRIEIYQSQADVPVVGTAMPGPMGGSARNQQIGENLWVSLTKEIDVTATEKRMVPVQVQEEIQVPGPVDEDGNPTTVTQTITRTEMQEQDVEVTYKRIVPDLSTAEDVDIFAFGYGKLKAKLVELFGAGNVVDC